MKHITYLRTGVHIEQLIDTNHKVTFISFKKFLFYIGVQLTNNVVLVSGISKVIQLYVYMHLFFFKLFSHLGYYRIESRKEWIHVYI